MPETAEEMEGRPEVANLVGIYAALSDRPTETVLAEYAGQGFGVFKPALADLAVASLEPITGLMNRYLSDPDEIDRVLESGADQAREIANPILNDVRRTMGFLGA